MSTFMNSNRKVVAISVASKPSLQINATTTLSYYIIERIQETPLASIDYQLEKVAGRSTEVLQPWTSLDNPSTTADNIFTFDITLIDITATDKVQLRFRVEDEDGIEYFVSDNDIVIVN